MRRAPSHYVWWFFTPYFAVYELAAMVKYGWKGSA
jgi:hypothetical protein